jgi:hypothetical protein
MIAASRFVVGFWTSRDRDFAKIFAGIIKIFFLGLTHSQLTRISSASHASSHSPKTSKATATASHSQRQQQQQRPRAAAAVGRWWGETARF